MAACSTTPSAPAQPFTPDSPPEAYEWLEDVRGARALEWVRAHNEKSLARLKAHPLFAQVESELRTILLAKDRIPYPSLMGEWLYNFWQDDRHVRGIWRRTRLADYSKAEIPWESVLDLDALATAESENWVWKGADCLAPEYARCLITLSRGGGDASVVREFDTSSKSFVGDGFILPEAKSNVSWVDRDTTFVGTDFGAGSLTNSGYPRIVKLWKRGTPLSAATLVFEGSLDDVAVGAYTLEGFRNPDGGGDLSLVTRAPSFFEEEISIFHRGKLVPVNVPKDASLMGAFDGHLLFQLRTPWQPDRLVFPQGALVAVPVQSHGEGDVHAAVSQAELVFNPGSRGSIQSVRGGKSWLYLQTVEDVKGRLLVSRRAKNGEWKTRTLPFPDHGAVSLTSGNRFTDKYLANFESFLVPSGLYMGEGEAKPARLKSIPDRFNPKPFEVRQEFATSTDGERIPYFLVYAKGHKAEPAPTLLYAYGGFEVSQDPRYLSTAGKAWLERGGVYVLANIRGGGEYGPRWHRAALKENRQKAFDDFAAVAKDLIAKKITSSEKLGIQGGSNGGLLMGVQFTQHPELFHAVLCQVPLLDMLRFHKLLAGHSWTGEYGNPDDPAMRPVLAGYSPFHNIKPGVKYPEVFFMTSTADDRVHPGHARKTAARMEAMGYPVIYFEKIEGGHSAAANLEQRVERVALEYSYLFSKLMPELSSQNPAPVPAPKK